MGNHTFNYTLYRSPCFCNFTFNKKNSVYGQKQTCFFKYRSGKYRNRKKTDMNSTTSVPPKEDTSEKAAAEAKRKAEEEAAAAEAKRKAEEEAAAMEAKRKAEESAAAEAKRQAEKEAQEAAKKQKTPTVNADGSVRYKIKWGDTLWDLSESFYKTPWLYKKIANHNKIKNPNLIISGTYIDIPPK